MNKPFFSIVVVSLNAETTIAKTINTVLKQTCDDYEIIVKDGLSKDNTIKNIPQSEKIKLYEKADKSIYDAMNQGIEYANGKFICFLNCGDYFTDEKVLEKIYETAKDAEEKAIVYGNYIRKGVLFKQAGKTTDFYLYRNHLCHQSMFVAKAVFEELGAFDLEYKICADYEHTLKSYFGGVQFLYCDYPVCDYMGEGVSESEKGKILRSEERNKIIKKYYSKQEIAKNELKLKLSMKKFRQLMISDKSPKWVRNLYRYIVNRVNR